eukprot:SAG11_NODE_1569_length_4669_cov_15.982276_1_plen_173_part_00
MVRCTRSLEHIDKYYHLAAAEMLQRCCSRRHRRHRRHRHRRLSNPLCPCPQGSTSPRRTLRRSHTYNSNPRCPCPQDSMSLRRTPHRSHIDNNRRLHRNCRSQSSRYRRHSMLAHHIHHRAHIDSCHPAPLWRGEQLRGKQGPSKFPWLRCTTQHESARHPRPRPRRLVRVS